MQCRGIHATLTSVWDDRRQEDAFWEGVTPLRLGSLPHLQDAVAVVGYPIGGDTISVTSGAEHGRLPHGVEPSDGLESGCASALLCGLCATEHTTLILVMWANEKRPAAFYAAR